MANQLRARKAILAEQQMLTASVDSIPDRKVKTPLQSAVQLLKRHRDMMFAKDPDDKPISITLTTLAARAYNEETAISATLRSILPRMDNFIEDHEGTAWVRNPVIPTENFADKWAETPAKRDNFYRWLDAARRDFGLYINGSPYGSMPQILRERLGDRVVSGVIGSSKVAAPSIVRATVIDDVQRAEAAAASVRREGVTSKPWAK